MELSSQEKKHLLALARFSIETGFRPAKRTGYIIK